MEIQTKREYFSGASFWGSRNLSGNDRVRLNYEKDPVNHPSMVGQNVVGRHYAFYF